MRIHNLATLALCLAVVAGSSLGLNRGMVLCVDHHGHVALEAAHVRHAHLHEEGADHGPREFAAGADHARLHSDLPGCVDRAVSVAADRSPGSKLPRPSELLPLYWAPGATPALVPPGGVYGGSDPLLFTGDSPPSHLACMRTVVLTV